MGGISEDAKRHHYSGLSIKAQDSREGAPRENPHVGIMYNILRDLTIMNSQVYDGSKTKEDPQDILDEVHKILCSMVVGE